MGNSKGPIGGCSPKRVEALSVLDQSPSGKFARDMAAVLDMEPGRASKMLQNLRSAGVIGALHEGGAHGCARRVRYYAFRHEETAKAANEAGRGTAWGCGRKTATPAKPKRLQAAEPSHMPDPIICPAGKDNRFTVHEPTPHFRALGPGRYDPDAREWSARVLEVA